MPSSTRSPALQQRDMDRAYGRWAPVYDVFFNLPFRPGREAATTAASKAAGPEGEILVVGVGTGLELQMFAPATRVTGIDVCEPMLDIARDRARRRALRHVKALLRMDAAALQFPEGAFDVAMAPYVMSVVPDPARVLDEMFRVVKPGGEIILLNHFGSERGPMAGVEMALQPASKWLGWHPRFPFSAVSDWLRGEPRAELLERSRMAPMGLFTLLRIRRNG